MDFCPTCGMLLQIEPAGNGSGLRFFCPTCPYICPIRTKIVRRRRLVKRVAEHGSSESDDMKPGPKSSDEAMEDAKPIEAPPVANKSEASTANN